MSYQVSSYKDIANKIIPFLDENRLLTSKYLNYMAFKQAINLMIDKEHLTTEGIIKIQELANLMNTKRSFSEKFNFTTRTFYNFRMVSRFCGWRGLFLFLHWKTN